MKAALGMGLFTALIALCIASAMPVQAYAHRSLAWDFADDFEGEAQDLSAYDPNYVVSLPPDSSITIDPTHNYTGQSSMKLFSSYYTGTYPSSTRTIPDRMSGVYKFAHMTDSDSHIITQLRMLDSSQSMLGAVIGFMHDEAYFGNQNAIYYFDSTTIEDSGLDYVPDTWYDITIMFNASSAKFDASITGDVYVDEVICTNSSFYSASGWNGNPVAGFSAISLLTSGGSPTSTWFDSMYYGDAIIPTPPETEVYLPNVVSVPVSGRVPSVDGSISHHEYSGSSYLEYGVGSICGLTDGNIVIYTTHDADNLYIAIDSIYDTTQSDPDNDTLIIMLDANHDHLVTKSYDGTFYLNSSSLEVEGLIEANGAAGFGASNRSSTPHRIWEISISRERLPSPSTRFGVFIYGIADICAPKVAGYAYPLDSMVDTGLLDLSPNNLNTRAFAHWVMMADTSGGDSNGGGGRPRSGGVVEQAIENVNMENPILLGSIGTMAASGITLATRESAVLSMATKMTAISTFGAASGIIILGCMSGWFLK